MRVVHVQKASGIGGSERHLLMLLPRLLDAGLCVRAIVLESGQGHRFVTALRNQRVETDTIPAGPHLNLSLIWQLRNRFLAARADLVHTHLIHADVHGQPAARWAHVPSLSTIHGTPEPYRREPYRTTASVAGRLAGRVVAISDHVAGFAIERGLASRERMRVIPYGIDLESWTWSDHARGDMRRQLGLERENVVVLVASRLIEHKGHDFLLRAFADAAVRHPHLLLLIAGDGPLRSPLEQQARETRVADRIHFLGFVDEIRELMHAADVVAFPTMPGFGEGFGLVNIEAMALARPIVATRVDSIPEIVIDRETGFLVDPGEHGVLADALVRLANNPGLREQMGQRGRARVEAKFTLDRMTAQTVDVYEELLAAPSKRG